MALFSQIASMGLAASTNVLGVTLGAICGQALCTGAAVLGGRHVASLMDESALSVLGGVLFIAIGAHALYKGIPA